jgi:hypothetical protein
MKKSLKILLELIIFIIILGIGYWVYFYSGLDQLLINLILINVFVYLLRTILVGLSNVIVKSRIIRYTFALIVNVIWLGFIFTLLLFISPIFTIAIISFLLVAISLTLSDIINNIASGIILVSKEEIEIGDLVEINNIQGIIDEINLIYTVIKELDGVLTYIPNKNVFNASIIKFTNRRRNEIELFKDKKNIKKNLKEFGNLITKGEKITLYTKSVEILSSVNPENLDNLLSSVFDKYNSLFGVRPDYLVDTTTFDRLKIILLIMAESPNLVLEYIDMFLRDILYKLYPNEIFMGWGSVKQSNTNLNQGGD